MGSARGQIVWLHQFSVLANLRLRLWDTNSSTTIEWLPTQPLFLHRPLPGLLPARCQLAGRDRAQFLEDADGQKRKGPHRQGITLGKGNMRDDVSSARKPLRVTNEPHVDRNGHGSICTR